MFNLCFHLLLCNLQKWWFRQIAACLWDFKVLLRHEQRNKELLCLKVQQHWEQYQYTHFNLWDHISGLWGILPFSLLLLQNWKFIIEKRFFLFVFLFVARRSFKRNWWEKKLGGCFKKNDTWDINCYHTSPDFCSCENSILVVKTCHSLPLKHLLPVVQRESCGNMH